MALPPAECSAGEISLGGKMIEEDGNFIDFGGDDLTPPLNEEFGDMAEQLGVGRSDEDEESLI